MLAPLPVLLNAAAGPGSGEEESERVRALFRRAGSEAQVLAARNGEELARLARRAASEKPPLLVAGGGDGTVNAVASAVAGSGTALGILPLGTLNHFARDLGLSLDLEQAARDIVAGRVVSVDVGEVNGRVFLNNSSIGLYPGIVRHREKQRRQLGRGKWHALFWATLTILRRSPFLRLALSVDGGNEARRASFVFIGNNVYEMEGFAIGQRARLDGGCLSVYLSPRSGRLALMGLAFRALLGTLRQAADFEARTAQTVTLDTRHKRLLVATDGEVIPMDVPLVYRIRPGALRVVVPARAG
jgi:diacylglycerol kinase family enzyme